MKNSAWILAVVALSLAAAAAAQEPDPRNAAPMSPERDAADWASQSLGAEAFSILADRRYLIVQGGKEAPRLQDAQWEALAELGRSHLAVQELSEAFSRFLSGNPAAPAGAALEFGALLSLPQAGLMTPALHSAARLVLAAHEEYNNLDPKASAVGDGVTLFETPWGAAFAARTRADLRPDPGELADAFFEGHLASLRPHEGAVEHLKAHLLAVYGKDAGKLLETDSRNATLSADLRGWIRKYLLDQRRLVALKRHHEALVKLDAKSGIAAQLADLATASRALNAQPDLLETLKTKRSRKVPAPEGPKTKLTSAGLHLHQPVRLERHELGDTVVLTAGYWVDGLAEGETAEIEETTFEDHGREGFTRVETRRARRGNGGLYEIRREIPVRSAKPFTFRAVISGAETETLSEKVSVPVSDAFDRALDALAAADALALDCRFKEADEAYGAFIGVFSESAKAKAQYADLVSAAGKRRQEAVKYAAALGILEAAIADSRADLSPERCDYQPARTENAIKKVASLPAGCDRFLSDLHSQLRTIQKRRDDQAAFRAAVSKARGLDKSCQLSSAADTLAQSLAILDANPSARCGSVDNLAKEVEADLPAARQAALWGETLAKAVDDGEAPPVPGKDPAAASLRIVNAALARIPTLPAARCYADQKEALARVADSSGLSLAVPEDGSAARLLPGDAQLVAVSGAVMEEVRRIEEARDAAQHRKAQLELPAAESAHPAPQAAPKPEPRPASVEKPKPAAPKPARRAVKRQPKPKAPPSGPAPETQPAATDEPASSR